MPSGPMVVRQRNGMFLPGHSGNPKGRPRTPYDLPAMCREHTKEAVEKLVEIMRGDNPGMALNAVQQLLDRGWGKPITPIVDETPTESVSLLHLIAARRVAEALEASIKHASSGNALSDKEPAVIDYSQPALE